MTKNQEYRCQPLVDECSHRDHLTFLTISDLFEACENKKNKIIKCRTIGILESINGQLFIKDVNHRPDGPKIRVSLAYMNSLQATVFPFAVQLFGTMQWKNRPVLFGKLVQVLNTTTALRLHEAMYKISRTHLAKRGNNMKKSE